MKSRSPSESEIVDGGDGGMHGPGERSSLFPETTTRRRIEHADRQNFQGDITIERLVACAIHDPHRTRSNVLDDSVVPELAPDHRVRCRWESREAHDSIAELSGEGYNLYGSVASFRRSRKNSCSRSLHSSSSTRAVTASR